MKKNIICIFLLSVIFLSPKAKAQDEEVDKLELTALLIKNENYNRAASVLASIKDPNDVQTDRFYTLKGILSIKQKRYDEAIKSLLLAKESGLATKDLPEFYETLSRAYLMNKSYDKVEAVLNEQLALLSIRPLFYQLKSELFFKTGRLEQGWSVLHLGLNKFSNFFPLKKQKWYYLFENNLLAVSKEYLFEIVKLDSFKPLELAQIAYKYRLKKDLKTAAVVGEMARMIEPYNAEIVKELARIYMEEDNVLAATYIFDALSKYDNSFMPEASELWRKSGYTMKSEQLVMNIMDPVKSLQQKVTLALVKNDFLRLSQLGHLVIRSPLKKNEDVLYTVAYANFMLGDFDSAHKYLSTITREDLFKKVVALKETIEECRGSEWGCI